MSPNFQISEKEELAARCLDCGKNLGNSKYDRCKPCRSPHTCVTCGAKFADKSGEYKICCPCRDRARI